MNPLVVDVEPLALRVDFHKFRLYLFGSVVGSRSEGEPVRYAEDMRVYGDALRIAKRLAHNHVGGLAANARKGLQLVHVLRDDAAEVGEQHARAASYIFRLAAEKTERMDDFLDAFDGRARHGFGRSVAREQFGRHFVHGRVGALRRENYGNGEREWVGVVERASSLAVTFEHASFDLMGALPFLRDGFSGHGDPFLRSHCNACFPGMRRVYRDAISGVPFHFRLVHFEDQGRNRDWHAFHFVG